LVLEIYYFKIFNSLTVLNYAAKIVETFEISVLHLYVLQQK